LEPKTGPLIIPLDAAQIEDAVLNLLLNRAEAIETEGRVTVRLFRQSGESKARPEGEAVVEVKGTGRGISEDDLERIFNPFFTKSSGARGWACRLPYRARSRRAN
jgi:signal transduction histidine kinase